MEEEPSEREEEPRGLFLCSSTSTLSRYVTVVICSFCWGFLLTVLLVQSYVEHPQWKEKHNHTGMNE